MVIKLSDVGQLCPDVLSAYLRDYTLRLSASEVSKMVNMERRTVSRILNKLVNLNLMNYKIQGKNKLFYFDLGNAQVFSLLNFVEINNSINFRLNNKKVGLIVDKLLRCSEAVIVFGSYASGSNKKSSDLDVVLLGKTNLNEFKKIKSMSSIEINEHIVSFSEFKKSLDTKKSLAIEILNNHIIFGDFARVVKFFLGGVVNG